MVACMLSLATAWLLLFVGAQTAGAADPGALPDLATATNEPLSPPVVEPVAKTVEPVANTVEPAVAPPTANVAEPAAKTADPAATTVAPAPNAIVPAAKPVE